MALFKYKYKTPRSKSPFFIIALVVLVSILVVLWNFKERSLEYFVTNPGSGSLEKVVNEDRPIFSNYSFPYKLESNVQKNSLNVSVFNPFFNSQSELKTTDPKLYITPDPVSLSNVFKDGIPTQLLSVSDFERVTKLKGFNITDYTHTATPDDIEHSKVITDDLNINYTEADPLTTGNDQRFSNTEYSPSIYSIPNSNEYNSNNNVVRSNAVDRHVNVNPVDITRNINTSIELYELIEQIKTAQATLDSNPELSESIMMSVKNRLSELDVTPKMVSLNGLSVNFDFTNYTKNDLEYLANELRDIANEMTTGAIVNRDIPSGLENIVNGTLNGNQVRGEISQNAGSLSLNRRVPSGEELQSFDPSASPRHGSNSPRNIHSNINVENVNKAPVTNQNLNSQVVTNQLKLMNADLNSNSGLDINSNLDLVALNQNLDRKNLNGHISDTRIEVPLGLQPVSEFII